MSLSAQDDAQLLAWFEEKQKYEVGSDENRKFRDLIFADVLEKLDDYFSVLKGRWFRKYQLAYEDGTSIIHDGLLSAVDNFKLHFKSKDRMTKFVTFLTKVLNNLAIDYARRNHVRYDKKGVSRKLRNMTKIPYSAYVSLDSVLTPRQAGFEDPELAQSEDKRKFSQILFRVFQEDESESDAHYTTKLVIEKLLEQLSKNDRQLLQSIMDGSNLNDAAKELGLSIPGIKYRLKRVATKFETIKKELWELEKQS